MEEKGHKGIENPPPSTARIFVGGLGEAVTYDELRRVFELCGGAVDSVDFVRSKGRSFAYVDFSPSSHNSLSILFAKYNGCVWKGGKLRLEKAKEHYLNRLAREWAEADADANANANASSEVPHDVFKESDESIRIFFPVLRKVKNLPLSGTGKHKYSFQRIDVPSLPKYFCGCEEHSGSTERPKQILHDGIDREEVNIMNKVLNALFHKQNYDSASASASAVDDSFKSIGDLHCEEDEDEDDLLLNVVSNSKENTKVASSERQHIPQLSHEQAKKETFERRSKTERSQDASTMQKHYGNEPPSKKKKQLSRDPSTGEEFKSAISASKIQHAEPQSGKRQSNAHVSWSQKSSWKELVGDNSSNSFHIASTEEVQQRSDAANVPDSDNQEENLERDSIDSAGKGQVKSDASTGPASKGENENLVSDGQLEGGSFKEKTKGPVEAQPAEPNVVSSQIQGALWMQKCSWTQLLGQNSSFSLSGATSARHVPTKPGGTGTPSSDNEKLNEIGNPDSVVVTKPDDESMKGVVLKDNKQIVTGNNESCTSVQTSPVKVEISETCTFMRSANSLKEWAKTKAALSGSLKRKGNKK